MTILEELAKLKYDIAPVIPWQTKKVLVEPLIGADPTLLYGVELEIEHCNSDNFSSHCVPGVEYHEDGSLRNNGAEFVTAPMAMRELNYVLNQFFKKNKFDQTNYSERCSVHVHINVQDMLLEQIQTLLLLYQVYERCLFAWVGGERDKNIFCVPWYATNLSFSALTEVMETKMVRWQKWQKYTALNLLPIFRQGTIEFRHMPGTYEVEKILTWCNLIGKLSTYARKYPLSWVKERLLALNNNSQYDGFTSEVFGELAEEIFKLPTYNLLMEDGVINMKYSLTPTPTGWAF